MALEFHRLGARAVIRDDVDAVARQPQQLGRLGLENPDETLGEGAHHRLEDLIDVEAVGEYLDLFLEGMRSRRSPGLA